jgi:hypothetical protein
MPPSYSRFSLNAVSKYSSTFLSMSVIRNNWCSWTHFQPVNESYLPVRLFLLLLWQSRGDLKAETEIVAAQDQTWQTKSHTTKILVTETDRKCRLHKQYDNRPHISMPETGKIIINKHGILCPQLHFNICKETGVKLDNEHWYKHVQQSAETSHEGKVTILWN